MRVNTMKDLRYLKSEAKFKGYAFMALKDYFGEDETEFRRFYGSIADDEDKNLFLKTCSFYLFLVKRCVIQNNVPNCQDEIEYISSTYKVVAIVSLIEALNPSGATKREKVISFFKNVKDVFDSKIGSKVQILENGQRRCFTINDFSDLLYELRSKFLHIADLILLFARGTFLYTQRNRSIPEGRRILCESNMKDLMHIFEQGLVEFFKRK